MRIFKLITGSLIIAIIALFIYQNLPTFNTLQSFQLNLYFREPLEWHHFLYTLLISTALAGFLLGILLMFKPYLRMRRLLAQERQKKQAATSPETAPTVETPAKDTGEAVSGDTLGGEAVSGEAVSSGQ